MDLSVHTPHPKYFGLFNPRSNYAGIIADLITATYNPQLAAWNAFAAEAEELIIREFATNLEDEMQMVFLQQRRQSNYAMLCALNHKYPNLLEMEHLVWTKSLSGFVQQKLTTLFKKQQKLLELAIVL